MSSISSQELAASASDSKEPECEPSRSARSTPSAEKSSPSIGLASPAMMTCEPSQQLDYEQMELLPISSAEVSLAKTFLSLRERLDQGWKAAAAAFGQNTPDLFASYDRATSSWRTSQACLVSGWEPFSETWPRSGMMRSGRLFRLPPLAPRISEIGSGWLATPTET